LQSAFGGNFCFNEKEIIPVESLLILVIGGQVNELSKDDGINQGEANVHGCQQQNQKDHPFMWLEIM
jgi:hypothetical protein